MVRCEAILFDLDGVLVDSMTVVERHWKLWAERHGLNPDEVIHKAHGRRIIETVEELTPHLDVNAEVETIASGEATDTDGLKLIEGADTLLNSLPKSNWAIATSGTRETALTRLHYAGLPLPNHLISADDVDKGKPNPDPYLLAAKKLGKNPERCVVIEDAPAGVTAAKAAGTYVIAVTTSHDEAELQHADIITDRLSSIEVTVQHSDNHESTLEIIVNQPALSM